jgi:hypothetical protein
LQHRLKVDFQQCYQLDSFVSVDSKKTPPWLGVNE